MGLFPSSWRGWRSHVVHRICLRGVEQGTERGCFLRLFAGPGAAGALQSPTNPEDTPGDMTMNWLRGLLGVVALMLAFTLGWYTGRQPAGRDAVRADEGKPAATAKGDAPLKGWTKGKGWGWVWG